MVLRRNTAFADVVNLVSVQSDKKANINKVLGKSEDFTHFNPPSILAKQDNFLEQIVIDPDDQLDDKWIPFICKIHQDYTILCLCVDVFNIYV